MLTQMLYSFTVSIVENKDSVCSISIEFCHFICNLHGLAIITIRIVSLVLISFT
jgi:hypothetical protein